MEELQEQPLSPSRLGLTQKDIMYLFVFKELNKFSQYPGQMYTTLEQTVDNNLLKSKAHFYRTVEEMEIKGWLSCMTDGRKKIYSVTGAGQTELENYRKKHLVPFSQVGELSGYLVKAIMGSHRGSAVPVVENDAKKLFKRLVNVKELMIYLILHSLQKGSSALAQMNAKEIFDVVEAGYGWASSEGYFYETCHAMEDGGWIEGKWVGKRRNDYFYHITSSGEAYLPKAAEDALYHVQKCYRFMKTIIMLLDVENENKIEYKESK